MFAASKLREGACDILQIEAYPEATAFSNMYRKQIMVNISSHNLNFVVFL